MRKLKAIDQKDIHVGCLNCSTAQRVARMDTIICVGFGSAIVTRNGKLFYDGEEDFRNGNEPKTIGDIEIDAALDSQNVDWRVEMNGPMYGETYQRQRITKDLNCGPLSDKHLSVDKEHVWVMVASNRGFA